MTIFESGKDKLRPAPSDIVGLSARDQIVKFSLSLNRAIQGRFGRLTLLGAARKEKRRGALGTPPQIEYL
jgi:hypothetical protein